MNNKDIMIQLRQEVVIAINARDAIDSCCSQEWRDAHKVAKLACEKERALRIELARNPTTRNGDWATPTDKLMMTLGYY